MQVLPIRKENMSLYLDNAELQALLPSLLQQVREIVIEAGNEIMSVYHSSFDINIKTDDSPVTTADIAANKLIEEALSTLEIIFPIVSEESPKRSFKERLAMETYWLIDPLDGTKEFINGSDHFTVNIALVHQNRSILGVVYAPALEKSYYAHNVSGSFVQQGKRISDETKKIQAREFTKDKTVFVASRSHTGDMMKGFLNNFQADLGKYELKNVGSSLKMCMVAEGKVDLYPRLWLTSEWDTAAAHCIVNEAGGKIVQTDMSPLLYNTKESLLNPYFFVVAKNHIKWDKYLPTS